MIIDVLVGGLSKVLNGQIDRLFGVCGATLYCVLFAYRKGKFVDVSVNSSTFDNIYGKIMAYIRDTIRMSDDLSERFDAVQAYISSRVEEEQK
jgi:hypothetical protein